MFKTSEEENYQQDKRKYTVQFADVKLYGLLKARENQVLSDCLNRIP